MKEPIFYRSIFPEWITESTIRKIVKAVESQGLQVYNDDLKKGFFPIRRMRNNKILPGIKGWLVYIYYPEVDTKRKTKKEIRGKELK